MTGPSLSSRLLMYVFTCYSILICCTVWGGGCICSLFTISWCPHQAVVVFNKFCLILRAILTSAPLVSLFLYNFFSTSFPLLLYYLLSFFSYYGWPPSTFIPVEKRKKLIASCLIFFQLGITCTLYVQTFIPWGALLINRLRRLRAARRKATQIVAQDCLTRIRSLVFRNRVLWYRLK